MRAWVRWKALGLGEVPRALDQPTVSIHGDRAIECLAVGAGPLSGWGVASHQVSLVGSLARALARRLSRGVTVRAVVDTELTAASAAERLHEIRWDRADVVFLSIGINDALMLRSASDWEQDMTRVLHGVLDRAHPAAPVFVLGIPPIDAMPAFAGFGSRTLARQAAQYNERTAWLCEALERVSFIPLELPGRPDPERYRSAAEYARWGEEIAEATGLTAEWCVDRCYEFDEARRAAAVERLGILDTPPDEHLDRIVHLARKVFNTASAGFSVVHGGRQWFKSRSGFDLDEVPRELGFCDIALRAGAPLIIGDALHDARFAGNPFVHTERMVRFYAGHPVRGPEGEPIGALCLFDPAPRRAEDVDVATLRDLALMLEAGLAELRPVAPSGRIPA
ncbi:MAG TPA: GDSL-type esterase/lipase family protein [Rhodoglobus sp.]|nr:GDSL-type esterase/lipase family protein [Rhodoglobus sp.]